MLLCYVVPGNVYPVTEPHTNPLVTLLGMYLLLSRFSPFKRKACSEWLPKPLRDD